MSASLKTALTKTARFSQPALSRLLPLSTRLTSYQQPLSRAAFTTSTSKMGSATPSANAMIELFKNRRSYYVLSKDNLPVSQARIQEIVEQNLVHIPSSFNSQSNRVVVLFGEQHDRLWDITAEVLRGIVPADKWEPTGKKVAGFKAGAGTVLFFQDQAVINNFQTNIPLYADKFPTWATQSDAMLQIAVWTCLEAEGLGANLQHYNPIIDAKVAAEWKIPETWTLSAQLVFGTPAAPAGPRTYVPVEERMKVYGA